MADLEETAVLLAAKADKESAVMALLSKYRPLLSSMAERYQALSDGGIEYDDFLQEANIAFLAAIRTYHAEQSNVTFGLYAKICIRNRLISVLRSRKQMRSAPRRVAESRATDLAQTLIDREAHAHRLDQIACLLSKREMDVFRLYLLGKSYKEISISLGITEKSVDNALFRLKAKLKRQRDLQDLLTPPFPGS